MAHLAQSALGRNRRRMFMALAVSLAASALAPASHAGSSYRSPINLAFSPDGSLLAVADPTWGGVVIIDAKTRSKLIDVALQGDPSYLAWNGADKLLVSEGKTGTVAEIGKDGRLLRRLAVAKRASGLAVTSDHKTLYVCDRGLNKLVVVNLDRWAVESELEMVREPGYIALSSNDRYAVVGNKLPRSEDARLQDHAAEVTVLDFASGLIHNIRLPGGSAMVRQIAISSDDRWAYVVHQLARANTMVTQLDRGWVMTNATSIIDLADASLYTTFLFDRIGDGAANPWGLAVRKDGGKLWATLAGLGQLATIDLGGLHGVLASDASLRGKLNGDLGTLYDKALIHRKPVSTLEGTRGVALSPDDKTLAVASYFEGKVLFVDVETEEAQAVALGSNPEEDQVRKGERLYNSGKTCYQGWLSCASCHEGGRMDGLNWDLLNDGQGNVKNTRSHVLSSLTPPTNITGCRENAMVSARAGYQNIEFQVASEKDVVEPTYAFIQSLTPEPSPFLGADGKLTPDAVEGKKIFESEGTGCTDCHKPPLFTDLRRHDVGTRILSQDIGSWDSGGYDTPTLVEVWRTAPYLHLGHALTIKDVLVAFNPEEKHGKTKHLSEKELDQLAAYVMQIGPSEEFSDPSVDAGATPSDYNPTPVETPDSGAQGGCICRVGASPGAPTRVSWGWMGLVGGAFFIVSVGRRRRARRFRKIIGNEARDQTVKGQRHGMHQ